MRSRASSASSSWGGLSYKWYFVRCQSGREDSIRKQLETRIQLKGLQDIVPQVLVPFERVTELKGGKRKVVSRKLYPGYLMVQADFAEGVDVRSLEARNALRETPGFGDLLGTRGEPTALTESQTSILSRMSDSEERPQVGDQPAQRRHGQDQVRCLRRLRRHGGRGESRQGHREGDGDDLRPADPGGARVLGSEAV